VASQKVARRAWAARRSDKRGRLEKGQQGGLRGVGLAERVRGAQKGEAAGQQPQLGSFFFLVGSTIVESENMLTRSFQEPVVPYGWGNGHHTNKTKKTNKTTRMTSQMTYYSVILRVFVVKVRTHCSALPRDAFWLTFRLDRWLGRVRC
jgi:hypothetical protein